MSTIASLISLIDPSGIKPWYEGQQGVNREAIGRQQAQTGLIELQQLKEKQAAEQRMFEAIQHDPRVREAVLGGGSILGSLGPQPGASGMPAPGPMTQQTLTPGQPHGAPQMVPGGQDLSQFATQGGPPQSTIASLGPAGQAQMQPPQNPLLAMAQRDPRAAMMLQGQMQAQQDRQWKMQEQKLKMGSAMMGSLGQMAQGVTDQAGWDQLRQDAAQIDPQLAARLPQVYSKEVRDRVVAQALDVKDSLTLQIGEMKARADQIRAGLAGRTDAVNTELEIMGLTPTTASPAQLKVAADRAEERQVRIHKAGVTPQVVEGEGNVKYLVDPHTGERRPIPGGPPGTATGPAVGGAPGATAEPMRGPMSADDKKIADYADRMNRGQKQLNDLEASGDYTSWKAPVANLPGGRLALSDKQQQYENAKGLFLQGILRRDSQGQISAQEWTDYSRTYFPQPGEGPDIVKQKRDMREGALKAQEAVLGRPSIAQPQGQAPAANTFTNADIAATMANPANKGKTRQQVIDAALAKGMTYRER